MADTKLSALAEISVPALADFDYTIDAGITSQKRSISRLGGLLSPLYTTGRLTLVTGNALPTTDQTGKGTLYYTSLTNDGTVTANHFQIVIYDGTRLRLYDSAEISLALTLTSGKPYDVFIYDNSGTLTLEVLVWTNGTTRATGLAAQSGLLVKSGTTTRRYIGTIYASGTNTTEDSLAKRFVWNAYNAVAVPLTAPLETADSWTYSTSTWRQANANAANQVESVCGVAGRLVSIDLGALTKPSAAVSGLLAIGVNSTTTPAAGCFPLFSHNVANSAIASYVAFRAQRTIGYSKYCWLEYAQASTTVTFYGDAGTPSDIQSGVVGMVEQ